MQTLKRDLNTSQCGTGDSFRNATYNGACLPLDSAWFLELPEVGKLRFDYISPVRPPEGMPPSSGAWGCSMEGYANTTTTADDASAYAEDEDVVYDELAQEHAKFSTLHAKEQFVQELVENLFAKKFEPRSKAMRKEAQSCPKNMVPAVKYIGSRGTGRFVKSINPFANVVTSANRAAQSRKRSYVDKVKGLGGDSVDFAQSGTDEENSQATHTQTQQLLQQKELSSSDSSDDDYVKAKEPEQFEERTSNLQSLSPSSSSYGRSSRYRLNTNSAPQSPSAAHTAASTATAAAAAKREKKKARPMNRFKEIYIQEVTEYWKDTAETAWARCKGNYTEVLKKKLIEVWQDELKDKATEKDIK